MDLKKFASFLFLLVVFCTPVFAQQDSISLATIVSKTDRLSAEHPFEKVYLHFDKPYYAIGDTIWFKAYMVVGAAHQVSRISGIVYVDIISSRDSIVQSLKLPVISGIAFGDITLSKQLFKQGNYRIRAYTNWMRNFGPDYFFNKTISIGSAYDDTVEPVVSFAKTKGNKGEEITAKVVYRNSDGVLVTGKRVNWTIQNQDETLSKGKGETDKNGVLSANFKIDPSKTYDAASLVTVIEASEKKSVTNTFPLTAAFATADVQFFAEGGELIAGVRSKVAFKAVNPNGLGVNVSGKVIDNAGNEVAGFTSKHAGMGIFALLPEAGKTYKATVTFPDGSKNDYDLPNIQTEGIDLAVNNSDTTSLNIKVAANAVFFQHYQNKTFYIVAQSGGIVYYTGRAALQSQVYTASVPKNKFPTGILQLTLFEADGEPLSERIVFIQHNDDLKLSLSSDLKDYNIRQHVTMAVSAKSNTLPVKGTFSVAVIDEAKVPYDDDAETTILSSILLTSDLRGYIEKPNYYFNKQDDEKLADLDILMLTQGYRRFTYNNILADKYPPVTYLAERGIDISGTLHTGTGLPVYRGSVSLILSGRNSGQNAITDANGQFRFPNVFISDSTKVTLKAKDVSGNSDLLIIADAQSRQPVSKPAGFIEENSNIDSTLSVYLQNSKKQIENSHVLKEVIIKGTRNAKITHVNYSSLTGLSMDPDQVLGPDILKYCSFDFEGCVMGKVFGLWHVDNKYYIKNDYDKGNKKPVKFFVNGLAVDDTYLSELNPADIVSIEVYFKDNVTRLMDFYDCNGIISITTNSKDFNPKEKADALAFIADQNNSVTITPKGYYTARVFYSPKYNNQQNVSNGTDLRSTIYWNPAIITDKDGNATFDYYNADGKGTYKAVIEGMDGNGNIGRYVLRYQVK